MLGIIYAPRFTRSLKRLPKELQEETLGKIDDFKYAKNHKRLKVHKLHGKFFNCFSFSVNHKTRIVFQYVSKNEVALLSIGDHSVYD